MRWPARRRCAPPPCRGFSLAMSEWLWHTFRANGHTAVLLLTPSWVTLEEVVQWLADGVMAISTSGLIGRSSLTLMGRRNKRSAGTTTLKITSGFHSGPVAGPNVQRRR